MDTRLSHETRVYRAVNDVLDICMSQTVPRTKTWAVELSHRYFNARLNEEEAVEAKEVFEQLLEHDVLPRWNLTRMNC